MVIPDSNPEPSGGSAVDLRKVIKSFGAGDAKTVALKGADFNARQGELHLVVGPSGCGKTTLLSVMAGTVEWDEGHVEVFGAQLTGLKKSQITRFRRQTIGFIFQQFNLIPTLNLIENVSVPLLLNKSGRRTAEDRAAEMLKKMGLGGKEFKRPLELSGGQQQRVAIARALVHEPRLVICDEPTSALDGATGHQIMDLLAEATRAPGRSVIIVTHDPRVYAYADRITQMEDGRAINVLEGERMKEFISSYH
jgi:putative ABC transport system ATP-binding protein